MITHYLPQWLLRRFGSPLYELNIFTGNVETRSVRKAGSGEGLWSEQIEKDLMGTHDNDAARVFRYCVNGKRRIVFSEEQRYTISLWLALFMPRVPSTFEAIKQMTQEALDNPEIAVRILYQKQRDVLEIIKRDDANAYAGAVEVLGKYAGEAWLMATAANMVRSRHVRYVPDSTFAYHVHLKTTRSSGGIRENVHAVSLDVAL